MTHAPDRLPAKLALKLWSARVSLLAERIAASFHLAFVWIAAFAILSLFAIGSIYLSGIFWVVFIGLLYIGFRKFVWPQENEIRMRLEKETGILHRPLTGMEDTPAIRLSGDPLALWQKEVERKEISRSRLRFAAPVFDYVTKDPYAVRVALVLLLIVSYVWAGTSASENLSRAFLPTSFAVDLEKSPSFKLTITPPAYTRKPQLILTGRPKDPLEIPQGSTVRVLAHSYIGNLSIETGDQKTALVRDGETDIYQGEAIVTTSEEITIRQFGLPRLTIPITYIKDNPPVVTLREEPHAIRNAQLRFPLTVQDDYGLKLIRLRAILAPDQKGVLLGHPVLEEQSVIATSAGKPVELAPLFDLSGHPWAGLKVTVLIEGEDFAGNTAEAEPVEMTLPERNFQHPVARDIVVARKFLITNGITSSARTALGLDLLLQKPDRFGWDIVATLAIRSASSRLLYTPSIETADSVLTTLWLTALKLEDGNLTDTQADLRKALDNLRQAVQDKKSPQEISELMQKYREALSNYMQAMQKEVQKRMAKGEITPLDPSMMGEMLDFSQLGDFLNQLEQEMMNGDMEAALKKLEKLQEMSEVLNPSMAQPMPEDMKQEMKSLQDLQKIIDQQQSLLDKTRASQPGQEDELKKGQDAISEQTKTMEKDAKQGGATLSESIGRAQESMSQSASELAKGSAPGSVPHQQQALDRLREGRDSMQKSLQQKMQNMFGISSMPMMPGENSGKQQGKNFFSNETVKIPTESEKKKNDEIIKVIRERAGDLTRPQAEREYYQRLLRQW
jgi:uncharacterized protein (TIGR02302 family)